MELTSRVHIVIRLIFVNPILYLELKFSKKLIKQKDGTEPISDGSSASDNESN